MAFGVDHAFVVVVVVVVVMVVGLAFARGGGAAAGGFPGFPAESFAGDEDAAAATADLDTIVEVEAVAEAGIDGGCGAGGEAEDVQGGEVGLGVFVGDGAAVGGGGWVGWRWEGLMAGGGESACGEDGGWPLMTRA